MVNINNEATMLPTILTSLTIFFEVSIIILTIIYALVIKKIIWTDNTTDLTIQLFQPICYIAIAVSLSLLVNQINQNTMISDIITCIWIAISSTLFIYCIIHIKNLYQKKTITQSDTTETLVYCILPILVFANLLYIMFSLITCREFLFCSDTTTIIAIISFLILGAIACTIESKNLNIWLLTISIMMSILLLIQSTSKISYIEITDKD